MARQPDGRTKLIIMVNKANGQRFCRDDLIFSQPWVNTDPNHPKANTAVKVKPTVRTNLTYLQTLYFNRNDLTQWASIFAPNGVLASVTGIGTVHELLVVLNNIYDGGFSCEDFADAPLPVPAQYPVDIVLHALPTSYGYTGQLVVTLANNVIPINEVITVVDLGDMPQSGLCNPPSGYCDDGEYDNLPVIDMPAPTGSVCATGEAPSGCWEQPPCPEPAYGTPPFWEGAPCTDPIRSN
jgi:hypothetical protein